MYYLLYGLLYLVSLLPFFVLYLLSDFAFFIMYRVIRYRTKIVAANLDIAFPEKSLEEKKKIAKQFYKNFADTMLETVKLLSMSERSFAKRAKINFGEVRALEDKGLNIQINSGHQMNWEFASLAISRELRIPWLAVYMKISARAADRLFIKIRSRFGAVMVSKHRFGAVMPNLVKDQYALGLIADQNPDILRNSLWLNFFSRPAPFVAGPEKGAMRNKTAVVFVNIERIKRGHYFFDCKAITEDGSKTAAGELTRLYRDFLEAGIRKNPDNYLWSHRRWKWGWDEVHRRRWVDKEEPKGIAS